VPELGSTSGIVVGVADLAVARESQGQLITYALGSCIGLSVYDPVAKVGGLLHYMLPQPAETADAKALKPAMYATTGIPLLLKKVTELGAQQSRLICCAAGGAEILEGAAMMAIGKRNRTILRKAMWKAGIALAAEDSGGNIARTMSLDLARGEVRIRTRDHDGFLWAPGMKTAVSRGIEP
jgi:chemotaxis protein CheD